MTPLLEVQDISVFYGPVQALRGISLEVFEGEMVALLGANGAGKTTTLRTISGMLTPERGTITLAGDRIDNLAAYDVVRAGVAHVPEGRELFAGMTAREHLLVAERARRGDGALWKDVLGMGRPKREELERVEVTVELLGLSDDADRPIEALSLGRGRIVQHRPANR